MKSMITIDKNESRFETILHSVSKQAGAVFSFSTKKIAADRMMNLTTGRQTLESFLEQIRKQTGLYYKVVGTHIIFLEKRPASQKGNAKNSQAPSRPTKNLSSKLQTDYQGPRKTQLPQKASSTSPPSPKNRKPSLQTDSLAVKHEEIEIDNYRVSSKSEIAYQPTRIVRMDSTILTTPASSLNKNRLSLDTIVIDSNRTKVTALRNSNGDRSNFINAASNGPARSSMLKWFIGASASRTIYSGNRNESLKATGIGMDIKTERAFGNKFSWTLGANFNYFMGKYTYLIYDSVSRDTTVRNFAIASVLAGLKYYVINNFYLSVEMGPALKASSITRTKIAIVPSAGIVLPLKNKNRIDVALAYNHIVKGFGTLESHGLQNGGYGFLSLRAAYVINGIGLFPNRIKNDEKIQPAETALRTVTSIDFSPQGVGFSYSPRLNSKMMMDLSAGIGGGYYIDVNQLIFSWNISGPAAYISITPKFFYNRENRIEKNKVSSLNSGNYFGLRIKYVTGEIGGNNNIFDALVMNLHWGLQRPIGRRWVFASHIGAGYAFDATDFSNSVGTIYPAFDARVSYVLSRLKL